MKVQDLINILQQCDPNSNVTVWNAYRDCEDENVHVSTTYDADSDSDIHIGNCVFENEITLPRPTSQEVIDALKKSLNLSDKQIDEIYTLAVKM